MVFGKHFSKYYLKYWYYFLFGVASLVAVDIMQLYIPDICGALIDAMQNETLDKEFLKNMVIQLSIIAFIVFLGRFLWRICIFGNGVRIETDIRNEMFKHMEKLSPTFYQQNKTGDLMAYYTNDLGTIRQAFGNGTLVLVDAITLGITAMVKMLKINALLLVICAVPLLLILAASIIMRRRISRSVKKNLEAFSRLCDYVQEDFSGISVIKAYVKEQRRKFLFLDYDQDNMDTTQSIVRNQAVLGAIIGTLVNVVSLSIIFIGGYFIYKASINQTIFKMTLGQLITFNALFGSLIWPVMAIGDLINLRGQSKPAEKRVAKLLDSEVEINDDLVIDMNKGLNVEDIRGEIEFKNVDFTYPMSEVQILKNVSFHITPGEMVGIMGATGCGKSTIVELLLRLYNLDRYKVMIDGIDIMTLPLELVRNVIAYVPQETFLFKQSIEENIAFAFKDIDKDKNHAYATSSGLASDIADFSNGFDTILGERGVTVSGGQKQRIAIARALIKDAPILIMDDSLSAVDTITESFILQEIRRLRNNKTTIIIAHRITTLETLDKIIVIDDGKISDIGSHEYLVNNNEIYQNEVRLQELEKEKEVEHE